MLGKNKLSDSGNKNYVINLVMLTFSVQIVHVWPSSRIFNRMCRASITAFHTRTRTSPSTGVCWRHHKLTSVLSSICIVSSCRSHGHLNMSGLLDRKSTVAGQSLSATVAMRCLRLNLLRQQEVVVGRRTWNRLWRLKMTSASTSRVRAQVSHVVTTSFRIVEVVVLPWYECCVCYSVYHSWRRFDCLLIIVIDRSMLEKYCLNRFLFHSNGSCVVAENVCR